MKKVGLISIIDKKEEMYFFQNVVRTSWENGIIYDFVSGEHFQLHEID